MILPTGRLSRQLQSGRLGGDNALVSLDSRMLIAGLVDWVDQGVDLHRAGSIWAFPEEGNGRLVSLL